MMQGLFGLMKFLRNWSGVGGDSNLSMLPLLPRLTSLISLHSSSIFSFIVRDCFMLYSSNEIKLSLFCVNV